MAHLLDKPFPWDNNGLAILHEQIASALESSLPSMGGMLAITFGEDAAHTAMRAFLIDTRYHGEAREKERAKFDGLGWRRYIDEKSQDYVDTVELTQFWRDGAEYAGQGIAPREPFDQPANLNDRKRRVKAVIANARTVLSCNGLFYGSAHFHIWKGVMARAAIDFGGVLSAEGLQLLSGVSAAAVRNAVGLGELHPDDDGKFEADEAKEWLKRRREFCPSRWTNPNDGQDAFDVNRATEADDNGSILVPQDADGTPFTPEHVVRAARNTPGLSITIGAKGAEESHSDFYAALTALAKMDVARWRRRNGAGNWGIVRTRGAWVAVSKAEVDRQLAEKLAEAA
ncbi:MAG: hypothetical protein JWP59_4764 [Massilia sp.]|nr:hypothetical protein [Massilia sp.]